MTGAGGRKGRTAMDRSHSTERVGVIVLLVCVLYAGAGADAGSEPFEVGQRWVYEHKGPRPGNIEPNAIDGQKVLHVISAFEENGAGRWVIEERYTNDPSVVGRLFVDRDRMLVSFDVENEKNEVGRFMYDPPAPYQVPQLEVGAETTIETTLRMDSVDFALPTTIAIQRLPDETVETPAGSFVDCQCYKMTATATFKVKIVKVRSTEERRRWYHPSVNGLVKEVYHKHPLTFLGKEFKPGYTATTVLTAFEMQAVETQQAFDPNAPRPAPSDQGSDTSSSGTRFWRTFRWIVLIAVAVAVIRRTWLNRRQVNT